MLSQLIWIILFFIFYFWIVKRIQKIRFSRQADFEIRDAPKAFWESLNKIYKCEDLTTLHKVFYHSVKQWPQYRNKLYEVYIEKVRVLEDSIYESQRAEDQRRELWEFLKKFSAENYEHLRRSQERKGYSSWYYDTLSKHPQSKKKGLFAECLTEKELKARFRRLAFLNHPDKGGSPAAMREIIRQYDQAMLRFR